MGTNRVWREHTILTASIASTFTPSRTHSPVMFSYHQILLRSPIDVSGALKKEHAVSGCLASNQGLSEICLSTRHWQWPQEICHLGQDPTSPSPLYYSWWKILPCLGWYLTIYPTYKMTPCCFQSSEIPYYKAPPSLTILIPSYNNESSLKLDVVIACLPSCNTLFSPRCPPKPSSLCPFLLFVCLFNQPILDSWENK